MFLSEVFDPCEHAPAILESCRGDFREAISLAHLNAEFAENQSDRDYWNAVAIALCHLAKAGAA